MAKRQKPEFIPAREKEEKEKEVNEADWFNKEDIPTQPKYKSYWD